MKIEDLMKAVYSSPAAFDFKNAVFAHSQSAEYEPYFEDKNLRDEISKYLEKKNNKKIIEICYEILRKKPFDIEAHIIISQASFSLGLKELFHFHNFIASSMVDCILKSGDGKNYHTSYKIYYPEDEIAIFTFFRKYPLSRVNHDKYGRCFDVYSFETGENMIFDVTIPFSTISGYMDKKN